MVLRFILVIFSSFHKIIQNVGSLVIAYFEVVPAQDTGAFVSEKAFKPVLQLQQARRW
jgi:hypothetical protein